ncbi:hypothetical protein B0T10DRAFT_417053, partial [Thelonectria olida]
NATTGHCQATLDVGRVPYTIRFDETGARLLTDIGTFDLIVPSPSPLPSPPAALPAPGPPHHPGQGYGISVDGVWITYQGRNQLWLPSEYRVDASDRSIDCRSRLKKRGASSRWLASRILMR